MTLYQFVAPDDRPVIELDTNQEGAQKLLGVLPKGTRCPYLEEQHERVRALKARHAPNRARLIREYLEECVRLRKLSLPPKPNFRLKVVQYDLLYLRKNVKKRPRNPYLWDDWVPKWDKLPPSLREARIWEKHSSTLWRNGFARLDKPESYFKEVEDGYWVLKRDPRVTVQRITRQWLTKRLGRSGSPTISYHVIVNGAFLESHYGQSGAMYAALRYAGPKWPMPVKAQVES